MARPVGFTDANVPDQSGKTFLVTGIDAGRPFARAELLSIGKGLLDRVVLMVAGAGYAEYYTAPETHWIDLKSLPKT